MMKSAMLKTMNEVQLYDAMGIKLQLSKGFEKIYRPRGCNNQSCKKTMFVQYPEF